jgi:hypothetical protein
VHLIVADDPTFARGEKRELAGWALCHSGQELRPRA